jgi:hypothetical protein
MASPIRELLADAQAAEIKGDKQRAIDLLKKAATFYRDRKNPGRALQMLRQVRRLEGLDPNEFDDGETAGILDLGEQSIGVIGTDGTMSFSDPSLGISDEMPEVALAAPIAEREPTLAPAEVDAWCSFCCRPQKEAGRLVAAPTGSYICSSCVQKSLALLLKP